MNTKNLNKTNEALFFNIYSDSLPHEVKPCKNMSLLLWNSGIWCKNSHNTPCLECYFTDSEVCKVTLELTGCVIEKRAGHSATQCPWGLSGWKKICRIWDYNPKFLHCLGVNLSLKPKFFNQGFLNKCDFRVSTL